MPARLAEDLRRQSAALWHAHRLEILRGVRILPSDGCEVSQAQKATVYAIGTLPGLPLDGCTRSPHCACFYGAVLKDDEGN